jgi:EpsI family protein
MVPKIRTTLFMAALMVTASVFAVVLRPTEKLADFGPKVNLDAMIPKQFGDWRIDEAIVPLVPAPDVQAKLDKIYNQTLARTYVNSDGDRVMLSIAYGGDQSDGMRVHRPEVCYAAQGFNVLRSATDQVVSQFGELPIRRLIATHGSRHEPITYWIVVGDKVVLDGLSQKLVQIRYGLQGTIPDGMLVRVSTIDRQTERAFAVQEGFVKQLLGVVSSDSRRRLVGHAT